MIGPASSIAASCPIGLRRHCRRLDHPAIRARGETARPIDGETTYTLVCLDSIGLTATRTATVRFVPTFQEI